MDCELPRLVLVRWPCARAQCLFFVLHLRLIDFPDLRGGHCTDSVASVLVVSPFKHEQRLQELAGRTLVQQRCGPFF